MWCLTPYCKRLLWDCSKEQSLAEISASFLYGIQSLHACAAGMLSMGMFPLKSTSMLLVSSFMN